MKHFLALCSVILISAGAFAVEGQQVEYIGGTSSANAVGTIGTFNTTSETSLIFETGAARLEIPYASIASYEYSRALKRRLGVGPAIAVSLVRKRKRDHFYTIAYKDKEGNAQVAVFEVSKGLPRVIAAILRSRVPEACSDDRQKNVRCGP